MSPKKISSAGNVGLLMFQSWTSCRVLTAIAGESCITFWSCSTVRPFKYAASCSACACRAGCWLGAGASLVGAFMVFEEWRRMVSILGIVYKKSRRTTRRLFSLEAKQGLNFYLRRLGLLYFFTLVITFSHTIHPFVTAFSIHLVVTVPKQANKCW